MSIPTHVTVDTTGGGNGGDGGNGGGGGGATQVHVRSLPTASPADAQRIKAAAQLPGALLASAAPGAAAAPRATSKIKPGKERWAVKTGQDADVDLVQSVVVDTSVEELVAMARPQDMQPPTQEFSKYEDTRVQPIETTIWRVVVNITFFKFEADGDFHLVLTGDSGSTMIGEVPMPQKRFIGSSPWSDDIAQARTSAQNGLANVPAVPYVKNGPMWVPMATVASVPGAAAPAAAAPQTLGQFLRMAEQQAQAPGGGGGADPATEVFAAAIAPKRAKITGVGFFDRLHGQTGVAATGIELHPILDLQWL
jgi:hypothetical protein